MNFTFVFIYSKHLGSVNRTKRFNAMSFYLIRLFQRCTNLIVIETNCYYYVKNRLCILVIFIIFIFYCILALNVKLM